MKRVLTIVLVAFGFSSPRPWASQQGTNQRRQVQVAIDAGKFDDAERMARGLGPQYLATLGDVMVLRGRLAAADSVYRLAISSNSRERRIAEAGLAELDYRRGDQDASFKRADALAVAYERNPNGWTSDDREAAGRAYLLLGSTSKWIKSALVAFDDAVAADSSNLDASLRIGNLFLEKFDAPSAMQSYQIVLRRVPGHPGATLGMARVMDFQDSANAMDLVQRALKANPSMVAGLLTLARAYLESEEFDSATTYANRALAVDSSAMTAWALLGAKAWILGDSTLYRRALAAAEKLNPRPAVFYVELAEVAMRNRRYADAARLGLTAARLDTTSYAALGVLGSNLLRLGEIAGGRAALERAFALDPYNLWHKNTLDLLDQLSKFTTINRGRFQIVAPPDEADMLAGYLVPLLEEAYDSLSKRYDYRPPPPIRIEIYRRHADFSVRTVGLAGLGALGVSFGTMLAMDSPSARERGTFNWGSTAWHELTHTFTLGRSQNRVPRWLSEGVSVYEERRARQSWGADVTAEFLAAYKGGMIRKASELNEGFVRARYPGELQFSYYAASLVCEMIDSERGPAGLVAMLNAYRDGGDTKDVLQRVFNMAPDAFDKKFDTWLRARYATALRYIDAADGKRADPDGPYVRAVVAGAALVQREQFDSAKIVLDGAMAMFPEYAGIHSPPWFLASIALRRGDVKAALTQLEKITTHNENAWEANEMEVNLREQVDDHKGAMAALDRMIWIWPADIDVHLRLASIATAAGDHPRAVRERRAILAMAPSDRLEARYQLAKALAASGDKVAARREVLGILETAPGFEKAQALLLELRGQTPPPKPPR